MKTSPVSFLIFVCALSYIEAQCTTKKAETFYKRSTYEFALKLSSRLSRETENHFIASPLSIWSLVSAISLGVDDDSAEQIRKVLRHHPNKCFSSKYYEALHKMFQRGPILKEYGAIFVDQNCPLTNEYVEQVRKTGLTDIRAESFDDTEGTAENINREVSIATGGAIEDLMNPVDLENKQLIILNAIAFKGKWSMPFVEAETESSAFYSNTDNFLGDVNMMFVQDEFKMTRIEKLNSTVLELEYADSNSMAMFLILPNRGVSVTDVFESLASVSLSGLISSLKSGFSGKVMVQIPRFKIDTDVDNLAELLSDMQLESLFEPDLAVLTKISECPLYVSNIIQRANVEVTEEGTTASAASAAEFEGRSMPISFTANKPFIYMIVDKETETLIFIGAYSKPSLY